MKTEEISRRMALRYMALGAGGAMMNGSLIAKAVGAKAMLGLDAHSVRAMRWKAPRLVEFAASQKMDAILFNGFNYFESTEKPYLNKLKKQADAAGIIIRFGAGAVSRSAPSFKGNDGTPVEAMQKGIRIAKVLGNPVVNCRIGTISDRYCDGGIERLLEEAAQTLFAVKGEAQDAGIKFAFENHAGDTRSEEVLALINEVGSDFLGAQIDPGNAIWAMEDPMKHAEKLADHVECMSLRDYTVWGTGEGAMFQWTALGDGMMDVPAYVNLLQKKAPHVPIFVETISNFQRPIPYLTDGFWKGFPDVKAKDIADFLKLVRKGKPLSLLEPSAGEDKKSFDQKLQKQEFEKSISVLRSIVG